MTHRDRAGDPSGQRAGRREAAGDAGHRQGFPTPAGGSPARPERRFPKAFGRRPAWLGMPCIAAPRAPGRKPWETVSMGHYQCSLVLAPVRKNTPPERQGAAIRDAGIRNQGPCAGATSIIRLLYSGGFGPPGGSPRHSSPFKVIPVATVRIIQARTSTKTSASPALTS